MTVWDAIRNKHAVRKFLDKPLTQEDMHHILEAGRRAPSGFNSQPWRFIVITERDKLEKLSKIGRSTGHFAGAAMGIVFLTPTKEDVYWSDQFDSGQCAAYMQLAAHEIGIGSCPATVYHPDVAREILGFPAEWDVKVILSFGYPDPEHHPDRPPKQGQRKPFEEIVHWNGWEDKP